MGGLDYLLKSRGLINVGKSGGMEVMISPLPLFEFESWVMNDRKR